MDKNANGPKEGALEGLRLQLLVEPPR